jgi:septum formation protein
MSLILASSSASRKALLHRLGVPFDTLAAHIDETPRAGESPAALVERLSRAKAAKVAAEHPHALVIGSDQVCVCEGEVTGKPGSVERAEDLLRGFSGKRLEFLTGVALLGPGIESYFLDRTEVRFRRLGDGEISRYVAHDEPLDCAGCFRLESAGPMLFESVSSQDPTALLGLPLIRLCDALRGAGYALP